MDFSPEIPAGFALPDGTCYTISMQTVLDHLRKHRDQHLSELCQYLRFPSISAHSERRQDIVDCAQWLAGHCMEIGLSSEIIQTQGHPVVIARTPHRKGRRHFLVYGHYDVQPADPLEEWKSPPFEPRIEGRRLFARGSSDNKGQHFAHLKAVEAFLKTGTGLPCNLTFLIEGEEEVGSTSLSGFLQKHRSRLQCDAVVISDTGMPGRNHPALTSGLRGIAAFEITVHGPSKDLHSGIFGGSVDNPAMALARILARLQDADGRVAVPGFYDDVEPLSDVERKQWARLPLKDAQLRKLTGVPKLFGEAGFTPTEQRSARPTLEINGLTSGYQGEGSKTIVPSWARAKITCRLVPGQRPKDIHRKIARHLKHLCPPTVRLDITEGHSAEAYCISPDNPLVQASLRALRKAFECEPMLMREGGSIPIVNEFKHQLGADSLLLGLALPEANAHSPNESFDLDCFEKGMAMSAWLWRELSGTTPV
jgi:acetylornithine deacetylase/succinyl-diaminopimelate desuccinylase-like protein